MKNKILLELFILVSVLVPLIFFYSGCGRDMGISDDLGTLFQHNIDPFEVTIERGDSVNIDVQTVEGISLSLIDNSIAPFIVDQLIYSFTPQNIPPGSSSSILHITVPAAVQPGTYDVLVKFTRSIDDNFETSELRLIVIDPILDFSIAFETDSITVAPGQTDTVAINISRFNNNTEGIDFVIETFNPQLNAIISPASNVTGNSTNYIQNVNPSISPGNYTVIVTGTGVTTLLSRSSDTLYVTVPETSTAMWIDETPAGFKTTVFNDVYFINANAGVTVGRNGTIFRTGDGGDNWINETGITNDPLHGVHSDGSVWYAVGRILVGNKGQIIRSITGSWEMVTDTIPAPLNDVFVKDANNIWTVGDGGVAYYTTDGGANWIPKAIATGNLRQIWFTSPSEGFIGSSFPNKIFKTTDGGSNWTEVHSIASNGGINNLFFVDSQIGYVVYITGVDVTTTGGGSGSWSTLSNLPVSLGIQAISFWGSQFGLLVGGGGNPLILRTEDGGLNWENDNFSGGLNGFAFYKAVSVLSSTDAVAVGQWGIARRFVQ